MKAPELMLQAPAPVGPLNYEIILPLGSYTSGTYSIPNGRTWDDFKIIAVVAKEEGNNILTSQFVEEQFNNAGWTHTLGNGKQWVSGGAARVSHVSSTTFSVSRDGTSAVLFFYGYLK
jgi:hypothetical protein